MGVVAWASRSQSPTRLPAGRVQGGGRFGAWRATIHWLSSTRSLASRRQGPWRRRSGAGLATMHWLISLAHFVSPPAGFMEEVIRGMAGHVPLKAIAEAIIHHYSGDAFGDFKVGRGGVARCFFSVCCRLQSGMGGARPSRRPSSITAAATPLETSRWGGVGLQGVELVAGFVSGRADARRCPWGLPGGWGWGSKVLSVRGG